MTTQQAQQLTEEAAVLCDRIKMEWYEARKFSDFDRMLRFLDAWQRARVRYERRLDKWAVAAYGPGVTA